MVANASYNAELLQSLGVRGEGILSSLGPTSFAEVGLIDQAFVYIDNGLTCMELVNELVSSILPLKLGCFEVMTTTDPLDSLIAES